MINVEDLLKPIADDKPCGEDFTYHPDFQNLENLARGKPETQFSAAEEPDWKEVKAAALDVLNQSKHLSAAVILTTALVKTGGLEGFADGLALVRGLTEKFWADVYPKLDPDDNNDPTERLNILNSLSSPRFMVQLGGIVLCNSAAMGRITLQQILSAREKAEKSGGAASGGGESGQEMAQVQAAFRDAGPESARATLALVESGLGSATGIDTFLDSTLGAGQGVNFETLTKLLGEMKKVVRPHAAGDAGAEVASNQEASGGAQSVATGGPGISGGIRSRADVLKALELICDFYRHNEPSSPVPLILQRAHRLVDKDFMTILGDLTPDALTQLQVITGVKAEA